MPYFHLSFCPTRKIIQHTVFLFNFTLRTRQKTRIFHQRCQKIHLDLNLSLFPLFRLNTILVTNRWNRNHLSWIFSQFLTFTLHTFVLTQMYPSPSPMVSHAYFGALRWLQYPNQHWERGKSHKCFKICDEYCRRYLHRCNYPLQTGPAQKGTPFPLSAYVQQCWRRYLSTENI